MSFLFYCTNQIGFSEIGGLITKFFSLFFKGMPNSIVFYKGIFFHVIPVRIFRKTNISYPLIRTRTCPYQGVINFCFLENLVRLDFLKHPFWDSPFCLITDALVLYISFCNPLHWNFVELMNSQKVYPCHRETDWSFLRKPVCC